MKPVALQIGGTVSQIGKTEKQWLGKLVVMEHRTSVDSAGALRSASPEAYFARIQSVIKCFWLSGKRSFEIPRK